MPIVAAVDRSDRAESVLEQASELADIHGASLHVVHVSESDGGPTAERRPDVPSSGAGESDDRRERARKEATEVAGGIADRAGGLEEYQPVGLVGDPAEELLAYSAEHDAEYIVASARSRSPVGKALFGSVTQSLLLNADRPVVTVPRNEEE